MNEAAWIHIRNHTMKLSEIAEKIGARLTNEQDGSLHIHGINAPEAADAHTITFLCGKKHLERVRQSKAGAVITSPQIPVEGKASLEIDDPYTGYALTAQLFEEKTPWFKGQEREYASIHPDATIDESVCIGPGAVVGPHVKIGAYTSVGARSVIENNVVIGEGCRIDQGVVIGHDCVLGNNIIIESNTVIGSNGFGNARHENRFVRIPSFGNVEIGDDVWIGALVAVDRASFTSTRIARGTRIDNMVHIAHNVEVGEDTAMAAQTGISGSTKIGDRVIIAGQVGFVGHISVHDDAFIGAKAGVSKDVAPASRVTGYPARDFMTMRRIEASQAQLPAMLKEIKDMKKQLQQLQSRVGGEDGA